MTDRRRALPSVDRLLRSPAIAPLAAAHPRAALLAAARDAIAAAREIPDSAPTSAAEWASAVRDRLAARTTPTLRRCVNATGVVLHTNLGRAPLARAALEAIAAAGGGYSSLEYDLRRGARGSRHVHCSALLMELTGAEDATVVNNAASALVLALAAAAEGGAAIVSRGELIEIGGGFRIPDIMEKAGLALLEVGTTNRTRLADYAAALRPAARRQDGKTARTAVLKVHRSNFRMEGFVEEAALEELVALGRRHHVPVLFDLGGGLMRDLSDVGLAGEPTLTDAVKSGAHAVVASGDKLLGGPQAGIMVGRKRFIASCRAHPIARAVRADKMTLAGLAATLALYRDGVERTEIPILRLLTATVPELEAGAADLAAKLPAAVRPTPVPTRSAIGGGAFPGVTLESRGVALAPYGLGAAELAARLRAHSIPVIATVSAGRVVLDVRALLPGDAAEIAAAVAAALER